MARKTTGSTNSRKRANLVTADLSGVQPAPEQAAPAIAVTGTEIDVALRKSSENLDEEIRRRAYELYLQRNGAAGDPNGDWFIAEREVRSRHAAAGQST